MAEMKDNYSLKHDIKEGYFVKHFKRGDNLDNDNPNYCYLVLYVGALYTETNEEVVVYQACYGDKRIYVRPLSMFLSKVDKEKYPEVKQKYRFEVIDNEDLCNKLRGSTFIAERSPSYKNWVALDDLLYLTALVCMLIFGASSNIYIDTIAIILTLISCFGSMYMRFFDKIRLINIRKL